LAALGEMAAGLAHEIRNPLGAIKASAQFLHDSDAERDARSLDEFLGIIVDEVDRLNRVVSSFLDFARPSKGEPVHRTDVNAAVERTHADPRRPSARPPRCAWTLGLDRVHRPRCASTWSSCARCIINLVRNAIQAMPAKQARSPSPPSAKSPADSSESDSVPGWNSAWATADPAFPRR
jgi:two-component system sensor histidine kinase HydH